MCVKTEGRATTMTCLSEKKSKHKLSKEYVEEDIRPHLVEGSNTVINQHRKKKSKFVEDDLPDTENSCTNNSENGNTFCSDSSVRKHKRMKLGECDTAPDTISRKKKSKNKQCEDFGGNSFRGEKLSNNAVHKASCSDVDNQCSASSVGKQVVSQTVVCDGDISIKNCCTNDKQSDKPENGKQKIMKKKKKHQKSSENEEEKQTTLSQTKALDYLRLWKSNRKKWSFKKTRQVWLLQHMFQPEKISDANFTILLEYLEGLQGKSHDLTVDQAQKIISDEEVINDAKSESCGMVTKETMERAKQVLQLLS